MIDRYCFVRLRDDHASDAGRAEVVARFHETFEGRSGVIRLVAGTPADDSARSWDVGLVIRCVDLAALDALLGRPYIADFFAWLDERAVVVKAWSFVAASPASR